MNLLPEDVGDILRLLDTLPFDEVDLETADLRVAFRRVDGSGWTQQSQVLREPNVIQAQSAEAAGTATTAATQSRSGSEPAGGDLPATTETAAAGEGRDAVAQRQRASG